MKFKRFIQVFFATLAFGLLIVDCVTSRTPEDAKPSAPVSKAPDIYKNLPKVEDSVVVLCYHTFLGEKQFQTDFSKEEFTKQVDDLLALGYKFITFDDLDSGNYTGNLNLVLSIDDGNHSVPAIIKDVLEPRKIKAALFIYPAIVDRIFYAIKSEQLLEFMKEGVTVDAHGYNHLVVTQKLYDTDRDAFMREVYKAKASLSAIIKKPVQRYAYPFGNYSQITKTEVAKAGYIEAFTIYEQAHPATMYIYKDRTKNDYFALPRLIVMRYNWQQIYDTLKSVAAGEAANQTPASPPGPDRDRDNPHYKPSEK